jgi:small subunit ribosomal protein S15
MPRNKGQSHQIRPIIRRSPEWSMYQPEEVEALIIKLAKEGNSPSNIGIILRDQYGVPLVKPITGKSITRILAENNAQPSLPEDLENLLDKAARLHIHLDKNKSDRHNKRSLQIIESRIRKLAKYYINRGILPTDWKYKPK